MKKNLIWIMALMLTLGGAAWANDGEQHSADGKMHSMKGEKMYACPMHSEVKSDKAGKCPKCEMNLEEVKSTHKDAHSH